MVYGRETKSDFSLGSKWVKNLRWKRKQKKKAIESLKKKVGVWIFEHEFEAVRGVIFWQKSIIQVCYPIC